MVQAARGVTSAAVPGGGTAGSWGGRWFAIGLGNVEINKMNGRKRISKMQFNEMYWIINIKE